jgi:hypothetical protein
MDINALPPLATTVVGSFPHLDAAALSRRLVASLDIPAWPQLPRRNFRELMYAQYAAGLPGIVLDEAAGKVRFDTSADLTPALEAFYTPYLEGDLEPFGLTPDEAAGFFAFEAALASTPGEWAKGQVTGPISFGLTVTDQNLRSSLYDELLADAIVKKLALNARWQARRLGALRPNVLIFVDEPYMAAFGSAFISLSREQVIGWLDEVFAAIHEEGALAGVHCCANTDWSVLLATQADVLNLDAFGYLENLALYPAELRAFLDRGGRIAWGIVPNDDNAFAWSADRLAARMQAGLVMLSQRAAARGVTIAPAELLAQGLIAPSCGLGSTSEAVADWALQLLPATAALLR